MPRTSSQPFQINVAPAASTLPAWVEGLALWQWYRIPGTALSSVEPSPRPPGNSGPASKIIAWCGAALKRRGSVYLIGNAGGHSDYAGNEVDALALNTASPRWVQLRGPTAAADIVGNAQFYLDYRPSAAHTYYASHFNDARDRLFIVGCLGVFDMPGVAPAPSGWPYAGNQGYTASFDLAAGDWDAPEYIARYPGGGDDIAALMAKHPITEDLYMNRPGRGFWKWTHATNSWAQVSSHNDNSGNYCGAAIDPNRNRMLVVGSYDGNVGPRVRALDGSSVTVGFGGLGAGALTVNNYPGVVFDEANDRFLVLFNSGGAIRLLRVHPETFFVDEPATTGPTPASRQGGLQNAAQYVPELRGLALATEYNGNVYFMRTAA